MQRELVQDVARGRDRIGAEHHRDLGALRGGEQAPRERAVAGHAAVRAGRHLGRLDAVVLGEHLRGLAESVARLQRADVGLDELGPLGEALLDRVQGRVERARVHPRHEAEREEVLAAVLLLRVQRHVLERLLGEALHVDLMQAILLAQIRILERIAGVAGLVEVPLVERGGIHDQDAARLEIGQVHLEGGRVHHHQRVELITRGVDPLAAELQLEARHPEESAGGGADLGREVGQRRDVVAGPGRLGRELLTRHLHAVARIPREANHRAGQGAARLLRRRGCGHAVTHRSISFPSGGGPPSTADSRRSGSRHPQSLGNNDQTRDTPRSCYPNV